MASFFLNKVINDIGTTPVNILTTGPLERATIIGLSLTNLTDNVIQADVEITDDTGTTGFWMKGIVIPPNSSLRAVNGGEKLILGINNSITVTSNTISSVDVVMSYVSIV